jgi:hypothetical protein
MTYIHYHAACNILTVAESTKSVYQRRIATRTFSQSLDGDSLCPRSFLFCLAEVSVDMFLSSHPSVTSAHSNWVMAPRHSGSTFVYRASSASTTVSTAYSWVREYDLCRMLSLYLRIDNHFDPISRATIEKQPLVSIPGAHILLPTSSQPSKYLFLSGRQQR